MSSGHSYDTYNDVIAVPLWLQSVITVLGVIIILVTVLVTLFACEYENFVQYVVNPLFRFARVTFGDFIKENDKADDSEGLLDDKFIFYDYIVSSWHIGILSSVTSVVLGPTFMSFWVSFIADETLGCDPELDCFIRDASTHEVSSSEPLNNCTSYDSTNGTVVCFEFVFDLTRGFSSAVGFLGVAVLYCRMYVYILIWLREICNDKCQEDCTKSVSIIMQAVVSIIVFLIIIIVSAVPFFRGVVFKTTKSSFIFIAYIFSFLYCGPVAGFFVTYVLRGAKKDPKEYKVQ